MNTSIYLVCQIGIALLTFGLLSTLLFGLRFAFYKLHIPARKREYLLRLLTACILFWLAILALLAHYQFFKGGENLLLRMPVVLVPPALVILVLLTSRPFALILRAIPERWLVLVQSFRILMEMLLWLGYLGGFVPLQMTFEWLNYDIIVGVTALMAAFVFFRKNQFRKPEAILWNVFGIALLLNVLIIGIFSAPSPVQVFITNPDSSFVLLSPFIWIPGFIVPFALAMHLFSLKQLFTINRGRRRRFRMSK